MAKHDIAHQGASRGMRHQLADYRRALDVVKGAYAVDTHQGAVGVSIRHRPNQMASRIGAGSGGRYLARLSLRCKVAVENKGHVGQS